MLSDSEQIIAARYLWRWLETRRIYKLSDDNLRQIASEAEQTEFSCKKITKYLNNLLTEKYTEWVTAPLGTRKALLEKQRSAK